MSELPPHVFHIALESDWRAAQETGTYTMSTAGLALDAVGFVHASFGEQVEDTGSRYYGDAAEPLVVLMIDTARVGARVIVEPSAEGGDELFPHIYGPIPVDAVVAVSRARVTPDGFDVDPPHHRSSPRDLRPGD